MCKKSNKKHISLEPVVYLPFTCDLPEQVVHKVFVVLGVYAVDPVVCELEDRLQVGVKGERGWRGQQRGRGRFACIYTGLQFGLWVKVKRGAHLSKLTLVQAARFTAIVDPLLLYCLQTG